MSHPAGTARKANAAYVRKDPSRWKNAGWTSVPNSIIRDEDIDPVEAWAWAWLASHDGTFEVSGRKLHEANKHIGRNRAYQLLSNLERAGLLLRTHEYDPEAGVPYIQYDLQPVAVPVQERTWTPPRAKPRDRRPHPGSKAARTSTSPVDNPEPAGQDGFPTGRESAGGPRVPDGAGIRPDQYFPALSGEGGTSRPVGSRPVGNPYIEEKKTREEQSSIDRSSESPPAEEPPEPADPAPTDAARELVRTLDYGRHMPPSAADVDQVAGLVDAATGQGLALAEVRTHCQAAISRCRSAVVPYLVGALATDRLPVPRQPLQVAFSAALPPACPACLAENPGARINPNVRRRDGRMCECHPDAVPAVVGGR